MRPLWPRYIDLIGDKLPFGCSGRPSNAAVSTGTAAGSPGPNDSGLWCCALRNEAMSFLSGARDGLWLELPVVSAACHGGSMHVPSGSLG